MAESRRKDGGSFVERDPKLSKIDSVRKNSAKRRMSVEARVSENKIITIGDYHTPLPDGWSYRESTKHKGKWYYISPAGQAQWIPPLVKTGRLYEWKLQLFIEFGPGTLGMNLKAVDALPDTLWTQFQVEIHTLRKLGNGHASPAEIYNWSVKPDRRIYAGFRIVEIAGTSVAGFTYMEVIEKINRTPRPITIGFCDCHRGLVGDPDDDDEFDDEALQSVYQQRFNTMESEYMMTMVLTELDKELWSLDTKRLEGVELTTHAKCKRLRKEMAVMTSATAHLQAAVDEFVHEKNKIQGQLDKLDMQEHAQLASNEELRAQELVRRQHALKRAIDEATEENERLMDEHGAQTVELEQLYARLDKDESNNVLLMTKTQLYDEYGVKRSPFIVEDLHLLFFTLEEAAIVEEQEVARGEAEVAQLKRHVAALEKDGVHAKVESAASDGSSIRDLEMKLEWLRDQLKKTTVSIAKAEKRGKAKAVKGGYRRKNLLKIEYQLVQDELQTKQQQLGPQATCPEEPQLLEEKTEYLRQALRDVVTMAAKCPKDQQQLYLDRRAFLKSELDHVMDRCLELGLPINTMRRSSLGAAPILSDRMSVLESSRSAFSIEDESPPGTPVYYPESLTPPIMAGSETPPLQQEEEAPMTPPLNPQTPPLVENQTPPLKPETPPFPSLAVQEELPLPLMALNPPVAPVEARQRLSSSMEVDFDEHVGRFSNQLSQALTALSKQPGPAVASRVSERFSVYSLHDSEDGDTVSVWSEMSLPPPSKIERLKTDLRNVVANIARANKDKDTKMATKLMKERNQIKSELALAQDEIAVDELQQDLREVAVRITQATRHNDRTAVDEYMRRRADLKLHLQAAEEALAKSRREAKPLDELKNELRAVVKKLQKPNLAKVDIEALTAEKAELKVLIMAKQPTLVPNPAKDVEALKNELRKVVSNITVASKENDAKLVEKLMRRRSELKAALTKAQDQERRSSDKLSRGSSGSSHSSQNSSFASQPPSQSTETKPPPKNQSFVGGYKFKPTHAQSFHGGGGPVVPQATFGVHQSFSGHPSSAGPKPKASLHQSFAGQPHKPSQPMREPVRVVRLNESFNASSKSRQNESFVSDPSPKHQARNGQNAPSRANESFLSTDSANSLHDSNSSVGSNEGLMSAAKIAQAALVAYREELAGVLKAIEKTSSERTFKKLLGQRDELKARIAATEAQLRNEDDDDDEAPLPPIPPLQPEWDVIQVKNFIETLQQDLRVVVKESHRSPAYMTRRSDLKAAINTALDRIKELKEEKARRTNPAARMDKETLKRHIDTLRQDMRQLDAGIAQAPTEAVKSKLSAQRSSTKLQLRQAQEALVALVRPKVVELEQPPPAQSTIPKVDSTEAKMLETYIAAIKADLATVAAQIAETASVPSIQAMHVRRQSDLKKNLREAQDKLQARSSSSSAAMRSSGQPSSVDDKDEAVEIDETMTTRMTQVYQNVAEKAGYLEYIPQKLKLFRQGKVLWFKLETSGCLLWYKSPSDTRLRGMVDLAQTQTRSVKVSYAGEMVVSISVLTPGMLSNHEERLQLRASSEADARAWVDALKDTVSLLVTQFPQQADDFYGRNSVVY
ncbi:Aste57867_12487 [Aphanomyces stellatus]|uniref:Aste57867_12487 protein n=1 Tax=Aphanomyces stellatus TaxID=120398 RepID=A0A485KWH0_9STRA|nr:hypothetical protein As57867_012441 [Aphanomyces stellatus]VFT89338.1 Aste57867_12487 [Aphanomyces stellatus]